MEVPVEVHGIDSSGADFIEKSSTQMVSRHGAAIALKRKLIRDQEVAVRSIANSREVEARVVGLLGPTAGGYSYGIAFVDPAVDLWEIAFPPLTDSELASARVVLECARCNCRELVYLDVPEAEVLTTSSSLSRPCKRCSDTSVWKLSRSDRPGNVASDPDVKSPADLAPAPLKAVRVENRRQHIRVKVKMAICVRHDLLGTDLVTTEDISRGGVAFKSEKAYPVGAMISVAIPYAPGALNVFAPARIMRSQRLPDEHVFYYGVAFIPVHKGWPGK